MLDVENRRAGHAGRLRRARRRPDTAERRMGDSEGVSTEKLKCREREEQGGGNGIPGSRGNSERGKAWRIPDITTSPGRKREQNGARI